MSFCNKVQLLTITFGIFLALTQLNVKAESPSITLQDNQYLIKNDIKLSWYKAKKYCQEKDMQLLSMDSEEKSRLLIDYLKEEGLLNGFIYWTSGTDQRQEGKFIWDATGQEFSYSNWVTGMPDNWRGDEHCVELNFRELGKWNDNRCWYGRHFICEQKVNLDELIEARNLDT